MASNFRKWSDREKQNPNDPLRIVLFVSRNKDNKDVKDFAERRQAYLFHIPDGEYTSPQIKEKFAKFVRDGVNGETSRLYVSVNARDPEKIKKMLMHQLIDDNLTGQTPLAHMDAVVASIAAKKECKAEKKWLFDFDINDKEKTVEFMTNIRTILADMDLESKIPVALRLSDILLPQYFKTPHGYAVISPCGFDLRKLDKEWQDAMAGGLITLKRDDLLCMKWGKKQEERTVSLVDAATAVLCLTNFEDDAKTAFNLSDEELAEAKQKLRAIDPNLFLHFCKSRGWEIYRIRTAGGLLQLEKPRDDGKADKWVAYMWDDPSLYEYDEGLYSSLSCVCKAEKISFAELMEYIVPKENAC